MQITHGRDQSYEDNAYKHRDPGIGFKYLASGAEHTPENFALVLGRQKAFYSPIHKHNFDQFRYAVSGDFSLKPDLVLKQGQLSYHPEGQYYGPQNDGPEERVLLVLQLGGASGQGYMSFKALKAANRALTEDGRGEFRGGKYYPAAGGADGGERGVVDGYQANWEWHNGRELVYPRPRYHAPICMDPESCEWRPVKGAEGVVRKHFGTFSERETRVEMVKVEKGRWTVGGNDAIHLLYVVEGEAMVGEERLTIESCVNLPAGETCEVLSDGEVQLLHFAMPMMRELEDANGTATNGNGH